MHSPHFDQAIKNICTDDHPYDPGAYHFLKGALDYTMDQSEKSSEKADAHVSAQELLQGFKEYALKEYGPMAGTLMNEWNVKQCEDVGKMVFNLIEEGMFGKQDSDKKEDFIPLYTFYDAFTAPFLPKKG